MLHLETCVLLAINAGSRVRSTAELRIEPRK
jgi:hypothetical protein